MNALCHSMPPKLSMMETEKGLVPQITDQKTLKFYRSIGMIFASAFNRDQSILTGSHFNPVLFEMIYALTQDEMDQIPKDLESLSEVPQEIQNKLLKVYLKSELPAVFGESGMNEEDLVSAIDDFVDRDVINSWMSGISSINNKKEFLSDYRLNETFLATLVIAQSMQQRIIDPGSWDSTKGTSAKALQEKIEGSLSKDLVLGALNFSGMTGNDPRKDFLKKWVKEATEKELEDFVFCISGSTTLQQSQKLRIDLQPAGEDPSKPKKLPVFRTCFFSMDLPKYESYEEFKDKLGLSIRTVMGGATFEMR